MSDKSLFVEVQKLPKNPELRFEGQNFRDEKISAVFVRNERANEIQCRAQNPGSHSWTGFKEYKIGRVDYADVAAYLGCDVNQLVKFVESSGFKVD